MNPEKIVLYIDNSNIFRGCKKSGWRPSYRKVRDFLEQNEGPIGAVHFFASEQELPREKQSRFYRALKHELGFQLHTYPLANRKVSCPRCKEVQWVPTEKGVDVGLVTQLLRDLYAQAFDLALIMSSDRDYLEAVAEIQTAGRSVKIIAWKWTLPSELMRFCSEKNVRLMFLEDFRREFEKPEGEVL